MNIIFGLPFVLFGLVCTIIWIWCIVDIARSRFNDDSNRIFWLLLVILLPFIGTVLYLLMGKKYKDLDEGEYV